MNNNNKNNNKNNKNNKNNNKNNEQRNIKTIGVVDIGSNTVKFVVYIYINRKLIRIYKDSEYIRLFNYLIKENNNSNKYIISREGIEIAKKTLKDFKKEVDRFNLDVVLSFATYTVRVAENKDEFINEVKEYFNVKILSEKEEAYYSACGALLDEEVIKNGNKGLICDMGGGSLELCKLDNNKINNCCSYPLGTLHFIKFFENGTLKKEKEARKLIRKHTEKYSDFKNFENLICVGGSIRAVRNISNKIKLTKKELDNIFNEIKYLNPNEIIEKYNNISTKRSETVVPAVLAMSEIMKEYNCKYLIISKYGIREGVIINYLNGTYKQN